MTGGERSAQHTLPAVYMRGGTSRALIFHARDLPPRDDRVWGAIFAAALGSPDAGGRQLDGLGGGISSLSKVAVVGPSTRADADVDYTFAQIAIDQPIASFRGNCGNISAAIGPFAVDEGIVRAEGKQAVVRIHNTNTGKIIRAEFPLVDGAAAVDGDLLIDGVAQRGAPVSLAFLDPGGAATGRVLPTGSPVDEVSVDDLTLAVSYVDAANPTVILEAASLGLAGDERPEQIANDARLMHRLESLRVEAAVVMGLVQDRQEAEQVMRNMPLVAMVSEPAMARAHLRVRMISAGQPHKATPLTGAMAVAVAVNIPGTIANRVARPIGAGESMIVEHPSGSVAVDAVVRGGVVVEATVLRTARRLMEGRVLISARAWADALAANS